MTTFTADQADDLDLIIENHLDVRAMIEEDNGIQHGLKQAILMTMDHAAAEYRVDGNCEVAHAVSGLAANMFHNLVLLGDQNV